MPPLYSLLLAMRMVYGGAACAEAPEGTPLHIRLTAPVGSFASRAGSAVQAVLIAPVKTGESVLLPAGSILNGEVRSSHRVGLGLIRETASLELDFSSVSVSGEKASPMPISTRVIGVDNGREEVSPSGVIHEIRTTGTIGNRAAHLIRRAMMWEAHGQMAVWAIHSLVMQLPEPEIFLPTGAELTLALASPLRGKALVSGADDRRLLTEDERASLAPTISSLPDRTEAPVTGRASDLVNVMIIGSRGEIASAFSAAGWTEARPANFRSRMSSAFAVATGRADQRAPMSSLLLNDMPADMSWQKGFNDFAKRHHVRLWRQGENEDGREIWIGAATQDIDYAYFRPHGLVTHQVARTVDHEREKIVDDLAFTTCAEAVDWWERPDAPRSLKNATGDTMETDGRLAIVLLNRCKEPAGKAFLPDVLPVHGPPWQLVLRRQILSFRSDMIRHNIYWRSFEGLRFLVVAIQHKAPPEPDTVPTRTAASRIQPGWLTSYVSVH
jgi:hypothetical protein